jgi:hypothetical protein
MVRDQIFNEDLRPLNTRLPTDLIRRIKIYCAQHDVTIQGFVMAAIEEKLETEQEQRRT